GLRLVTADKGIVVPANIWGKLKTAFTMVAEVFVLVALAFGLNWSWIPLAESILIWISAGLTVISGGTYLIAYKDHISADK
ncbi:MAG: CDP-diacylglycerol--glycerol-3-phosphate 3-phosphatidyltransferase, partial [Oscillospiraceae bacterium]|nr:CDP-diacylglycerol--glycerol-3-phosphate 3-phosphatidyltransferase [Oscillospiraceae bacterium]